MDRTMTGRDKTLPDIPVDVDVLQGPPPSPSVDTNKALPSIKVESMLSEEEMIRLHELWNGAGLIARAHRRRRHGQGATPHRAPPPMSISEHESTLPTLFSPGTFTANTTLPTTTGRRGLFNARPFLQKHELEKRVSNTLEALRAKARSRLKKRLRYTKSAPNLGDQGAPPQQGATLQPPMPPLSEGALVDMAIGDPTPSSSGELATPEVVLQPEDMDEDAIYFTIDPDWRVSQGSMQLLFITPVPDSPTLLGRPDSLLLHRHHSLDQLSFAAQQAAKTLTTMDSLEEYPSNDALRLIDELHTYPEYL